MTAKDQGDLQRRSTTELARPGKTVPMVGTAETPYVMTPITNETAPTDTWDRDDPPEDTDGVTVADLVGVQYNEAGDQVVYEFYREKTWDSDGKLKSINIAVRSTVDTPGPCV